MNPVNNVIIQTELRRTFARIYFRVYSKDLTMQSKIGEGLVGFYTLGHLPYRLYVLVMSRETDQEIETQF